MQQRPVQKHPELAYSLGKMVEWGGILARSYMYVEAAKTGAMVCAVGGPAASLGCAVGGMALVYMGEKAFASGVETGIQALGQDAAQQARSVQEAQYLETGIKDAAQSLLLGLSLTGLRKTGQKFHKAKNLPTPDYSTPHAPYSLRIDPLTGKGPMHVDSNLFTKADKYSKLGAPKNAKEFWSLWQEKYPGALSNKNLEFLSANRAPRVDSQWIINFPEHQKYLGQALEHHHIDHGFLTTPLPKELHRGKGNNTYWHNITGDKN